MGGVGHLAGGLRRASRSTIMPGGPGGRGHQTRIAHGHEPVVQRYAPISAGGWPRIQAGMAVSTMPGRGR